MSMINTLFLDIGGVLLTNGWDRGMRNAAKEKFYLEKTEFDHLHKEYYNLYEQGKINLSDYLDKVVFWKKRDFTKLEFEAFIKEQSQPYSETLNYFLDLKKQYNLKVVALSNEGREIADYRIKTFDLCKLFDFFIISAFVGYQKPDYHIFQMAFDLTKVPLDEILYIDDRSEMVDAIAKFGIKGIRHTSLEATKKEIEHLLH